MEYKTKITPINKIIPYEDNARINDKAVEKVAQSIKEYGWQSPIVVDEDMVILAGHSRLKAASLLNLDKVPVKIAEGLNDQQKMAYRLMDNKSQDFAQWDNKLLAKEFEKLSLTDFDMKLTGFDLDEIGKLNESMLEFSEPSNIEFDDLGINDNFEIPETNIKQFMLLFDKEQTEKFKDMLEVLKDKYGLENPSDVVYKAVENETNT